MLRRHHKLWSNRVRCVTAVLQYNSYVALCVTNLHSSIQIWAKGSNAGCCNYGHCVVSNAGCNYDHCVVSNAGCNYGHCVVSIICCISHVIVVSLPWASIIQVKINLSCVCVCTVRLGIHSSVQ